MDTIPVHNLTDEAGPEAYGPARDALNHAQLIMGRCTRTGNEFLLFGRGHLRRIVEKGESEPLLGPVWIELDQQTTELEFACAAIETLRGHHDYEPGEQE